MSMTIKIPGYKLSPRLNKIITNLLIKHNAQNEDVTINFRDPNYSASTGGFQPVEICIDSNREIQYITDFRFVGVGEYAELAKELDFDFANCTFRQTTLSNDLYRIGAGAEIFKLWQRNFVEYYAMEVYGEIEIS